MENGVDYYCTYILHCCYCWSFFHHTGRWCNEDCFKIVFRRRPCSAHYHAHYHAGDHAQEAETQDEEVQHRATGIQIQTHLNFIYFFVCVCVCVPVCACLFVQHWARGIQMQIHIWTFTQGHRDINIQQRLIFQCMPKKCLILTQGDTFRRFPFSKILEFLFRRCWHYHFVLLHRQPSQTRPHHRSFKSPVSSCPRSLCLCLIRYSFFMINW